MKKTWLLIFLAFCIVVLSFWGDSIRMGLRETVSTTFDFTDGIIFLSIATLIFLIFLFSISYSIIRFPPTLLGSLICIAVGLLLVAIPFLRIRGLPFIAPPESLQITYLNLSGLWFLINGVFSILRTQSLRR
jgi:hypothetical protein